MIRSKIIPILVAAFCGLAMQFQASGANAQGYVATGSTITPGWGWCDSDYWCVWMVADGSNQYAGFYDPNNNLIWNTPTVPYTTVYGTCGGVTLVISNNAFFSFQYDGNLVLDYTSDYACSGDQVVGGGRTTRWRTGTTNWNGDPGVYLVINDGWFGVFDANWNPLWTD